MTEDSTGRKHRARASGTAVIVVVAVVAVAGCLESVAPTASASMVIEVPAPHPMNAHLAESEIAKAIAFRESVGIRADRTWVLAVAEMDGVDVVTFGVPVTTPERTALLARAVTAEAVTDAIVGYGVQHPDFWAGVYVDDGVVVARFTGDPAAHQAALRTLLGPTARYRLEPATWPMRDLMSLRDRIAHDGWLRGEDYDLLDLGANVKTNVVELLVSSRDPRAPQQIAAHYAAGSMLIVTTDGTGVTSMERGSLAGVAVDRVGAPVAGLDVEVVGAIPGTGMRGDRGVETDAQGRFLLADIQATSYELSLFQSVGPGGQVMEGAARHLAGSARVDVRPGATTFIEIRVNAGS